MNRVTSVLRNLYLYFPLTALLIVAGLFYVFMPPVSALATQRSVLISDGTASATATYTLAFTISAPETLGSIKLLFCANSPLLTEPCTAPSGFDISGATLASQAGETGFSVYGPGTNANTLVLVRAPATAAAGSVSYELTGVVNPDTVGSFYGRLQTFATGDAGGAENDSGGLALALTNAIQVSTEVPPYLLFCGAVTISAFDCGTVSGDYINFGNLTAGSTASASSQLLSATNAQAGFTISVYGQTMTSGNNTIAAINPQDVSRPGLAQFGLNLVKNVSPSVGSDPVGPGSAAPLATYNQADFFRFASSSAIASTPSVDDYKKLTVSYIINIPVGQPVGVYSTTLTYVCLANF